MPPYLTRIEGPPPKRNVVRSSRAGGAICIASPVIVMITGEFAIRELNYAIRIAHVYGYDALSEYRLP